MEIINNWTRECCGENIQLQDSIAPLILKYAKDDISELVDIYCRIVNSYVEIYGSIRDEILEKKGISKDKYTKLLERYKCQMILFYGKDFCNKIMQCLFLINRFVPLPFSFTHHNKKWIIDATHCIPVKKVDEEYSEEKHHEECSNKSPHNCYKDRMIDMDNIVSKLSYGETILNKPFIIAKRIKMIDDDNYSYSKIVTIIDDFDIESNIIDHALKRIDNEDDNDMLWVSYYPIPKRMPSYFVSKIDNTLEIPITSGDYNYLRRCEGSFLNGYGIDDCKDAPWMNREKKVDVDGGIVCEICHKKYLEYFNPTIENNICPDCFDEMDGTFKCSMCNESFMTLGYDCSPNICNACDRDNGNNMFRG